MAVKKTKSGKSWMYDLRNPQGKRIRKAGFNTEKEAKDAVATLKAEWFRQKYNLPLDEANDSKKTFVIKAEVIIENPIIIRLKY